MSDVHEIPVFDEFHHWRKNDFPAYFPPRVVEALQESPGWMHWYPIRSLSEGESIVGHMLDQWADHNHFLLEALHKLADAMLAADVDGGAYGVMAAIRRHEQDLQDILRYAQVTVDMGPGYHTPRELGSQLLWLYGRPEQSAEVMPSVTDEDPTENLEELRQ